jgi:hypothetical protein
MNRSTKHGKNLKYTSRSNPSTPGHGPTQNPPGIVSEGIKQNRRKDDYTFPPRFGVQSEWSYHSTPHMS